MNFESLEQIRFEAVDATLKALTNIVTDDKAELDARLKAAKLIDSFSDTMVHAYLISNAVAEDASTKNKLLKGLDKLHGNSDDER